MGSKIAVSANAGEIIVTSLLIQVMILISGVRANGLPSKMAGAFKQRSCFQQNKRRLVAAPTLAKGGGFHVQKNMYGLFVGLRFL